MSTSYELGLSLDGLTFYELMALKRKRVAELSSYYGKRAALQDQLDRIDAALRKLQVPDA